MQTIRNAVVVIMLAWHWLFVAAVAGAALGALVALLFGLPYWVCVAGVSAACAAALFAGIWFEMSIAGPQ